MKTWNVFCCVLMLIGVSTLTVAAYYVAVYSLFPSVQREVANGLSRNIGDFLWGTLGILLTFGSTTLMVVTFYMQRKQFDETQKDAFRTRFEGTFFNMLSMLSSVRAESDKSVQKDSRFGVADLKEFYHAFKQEYADKMSVECALSESVRVLRSSDIQPTQYEAALNDLGNFYDEYIEKHGCCVGFYFRYVHNLITFVLSHWKGSYMDIHTYLNFIQAQMSDEELALLFYDSISKKGEDKKRRHTFKENLDVYSFLENVSENMLLERSHYKIFPHTMFCFLNEDERKKVLCTNKKVCQ